MSSIEVLANGQRTVLKIGTISVAANEQITQAVKTTASSEAGAVAAAANSATSAAASETYSNQAQISATASQNASENAAESETQAAAAATRAADSATDSTLAAGMTPYELASDLPASGNTAGARARVWGDTIANNGYYTANTAGVFVRDNPQPATSSDIASLETQLSSLFQFDPETEISHEFVDKNGFIIAYLLATGVMNLAGIELDSLQFNGDAYSIIRSADGIEIADPHGFIAAALGISGGHLYGLDLFWNPDVNEISLIDKHGFYIFYAGPYGSFFGAPAVPASSPVVVSSDMPYMQFTGGSQVRTDIMHIEVYGQSLSRGDHTVTPISTTQPYANVMPASGVLVRTEDPEYAFTGFSPLIEQAFTDTSTGASGLEAETPTSGMLNEIVRRMVALGEVATNWVFLGHSGGQGGQIVQTLSEGGSTGRWEQVIKLITDAYTLAISQGKTYSVWAMQWDQGETNYTSGSSDKTQWAYVQRWMTAMWDPFKRKVMQITGQLFSPLLVTYQVADHRQAGSDTMPIAMAHWLVSRQRDDTVLGAPCYMFPTGPDQLHLTPEASWLMGVYMGRALQYTMCANNGKWRPLEPVSVSWADDHIDVRYYVPCKPLVIDDALATTYANAGFIIRNADESVANIISGVTVLDAETIRITLSAAAAVGAYLTYARGQPGDPAHSGPASGARGNVRDSHGVYDQVTSPLGNTFSLHNASVMFQYSRQFGFN